MATSTISPGMAKGTNTVNPSCLPTAFPSAPASLFLSFQYDFFFFFFIIDENSIKKVD
jgi:hypothetical protein